MSAFRTILVATDFSPHAEAALELALEFARETKGTLHLLHVARVPVEIFSPYDIAVPEQLVKDAHAAASAQLERTAQRVRHAGLACEVEIDAGPAADTILARAKALDADLIAMGTRGLSGLRHLLLGSVAERVLRTAPCPVLTAHAADG